VTGLATAVSSTDNPWPLPPLIPGDWKTLSLADSCAVLARYTASEVIAGLTPSAEAVEYSRVRARPLIAAPKWLLMEAEAKFADGAVGLLTMLYGPGFKMIGATWTPGQLTQLGWQTTWPEDAISVVKDYLYLFVNYTRGDDGRFIIVESPADVQALSRSGEKLDARVATGTVPLVVTADGAQLHGAGSLVYAGQLWQMSFDIGRDGSVEMVEDNPICEVPVDIEDVRGPFRVIGKNTKPASASNQPDTSLK
jgi:hypothetical protein